MSRPLRFTFVVSRYASDILGGAEKHARDVAEQLAARGHDVRVLTTCARQYSSWKNELPAGVSHEGGVEVVRFPIPLRRLVGVDDVLKTIACALPRLAPASRAWYFAAGPVCPALARRAVLELETRDLVTHFSLQSWVTAQALERAPGRAGLVPLVHDEPPTYLSRAAQSLRQPAVVLANTEEEWARIEGVAGPSVSPGLIVATGQGPVPPRDPAFRPPVAGPYLLLLGRMAKARPVLAAYRALRALDETIEVGGRRVPARELTLLAVGERHAAFEGVPGVHLTGFVDDATRWQLLHRATALVNPSRYESLSLVLLEAWACGVPVVVNQACDVTVGQCRRSGGGFAVDFSAAEVAARALVAGLADEQARVAMGRAGAAYVATRYGWDRVCHRYEAVAQALATGRLDVARIARET